MKKIKFVFIAVIICLSANIATAQTTGTFLAPRQYEVPQNVVKLNLSSIAVLHANLSYQRAFANHFAGQVALLYGSQYIPINIPGFEQPYVKGLEYQGYGITPEFRWYPLKAQKAPRGWYMSPFFQYRNYDVRNRVDASSPFINDPKNFVVALKMEYFGGGIATGYQFMFGKRKNLVIDILLGAKYGVPTLGFKYEGTVDPIKPIKNPSASQSCTDPNDINCYIVTQNVADAANKAVNTTIRDFNNRSLDNISLGFLSQFDFLRSALYVGYAF